MSRDEFIKADRRVRRYLNVILFLTACAAVAVGLALPAWAAAREWLHAQGEDSAVRLLIDLSVGVAVVVALLLLPFLAIRCVDRRFGLRCPGCQRSLTLPGRHSETLRTGRCYRCQQTLFEPGD